ncbi:hypothetical protein VNI00_000535 [Paramarasmius palmivorus]|uniref:C-CAP/cofactor C-like domain-containing protein n=1 Tax=Paramarasmius palmivorus TaxID=297713 RepID=A0AAW0EBN7_9AGAR
MSSDTLRWGFAQKFLAEFQDKRAELETRVTQAKSSGVSSRDVLDALSTEFAALSKSLIDATGDLPNFDQKNCESQLKHLETMIQSMRESSIPKAKFAFKRKTKTEMDSPKPTSAASVPSTEDNSASRALSISTISKTYISQSALPESHPETPDLVISDLDHCIMDLTRHEGKALTISALHIRNISNSALILPCINGSAMLHDVINCVIVLGCHQFRMHTSRDVDVYLSIQSNPIIEHCAGIRFGSYPSSVLPGVTQNVLSVQDFSHIKPTPSPNWRFLSEEEKLDAKEGWYERLSPSDEDISPILDELLPNVTTK